MNIFHYKQTTIAQAPDELSKAINKYSEHFSDVGRSSCFGDKYDIIHFHNKTKSTKKPSCIQYHSEPFKVNLRANVNKKLVIAQYHATLDEYRDCQLVRNVVDYNTELYKKAKSVLVDDKIRVAFSPSVKYKPKNSKWYWKGYKPTRKVLNKVKSMYPNRFDYDIITGVPLSECIDRKSKCNIVIDELVTPSYHRSALEGLALGKMTLCSISDEISRVMCEASGATKHPFENVKMDELESFLITLLEDNDILRVLERGVESRNWMEQYWNPQDIVNEFIEIYREIK